MTGSRIIHVERIDHDPLLGQVSGTVIRRRPDGSVHRQRLSLPVKKPSLGHAEAAARLRERAETR